MDERPKRKLERDLKRYRALLKLTADERALAVLKQLISETVDRLDDQWKPVCSGAEMMTTNRLQTNQDKMR